jgi:hypothetical protein
MISRSTLLIGAVALAASVACAQEEQSANSAGSASSRYWTAARIQQEPSRKEASSKTLKAPPDAKALVIENELLEVSLLPESGRAAFTYKPTHRMFASDAGFNATGGTARVVGVSDKLYGVGKAIQISYASGDFDLIMLFPKLPFAFIRSSLHNGGNEPTVIRTVRPFQAAIDLGKPASALTTLGTGGLLTADKNPGSYDWLAVADPETRNGAVFG